MTGRCPREAALSIRYRYLPTTLTATSCKEHVQFTSGAMTCDAHSSLSMPLLALFARRGLDSARLAGYSWFRSYTCHCVSYELSISRPDAVPHTVSNEPHQQRHPVALEVQVDGRSPSLRPSALAYRHRPQPLGGGGHPQRFRRPRRQRTSLLGPIPLRLRARPQVMQARHEKC